jgi:hypothetical protein
VNFMPIAAVVSSTSDQSTTRTMSALPRHHPNASSNISNGMPTTGRWFTAR